MKLNIDFNWVTVILVFVFCFTSILMINKFIEFQVITTNYNKFVLESSPVVYDYLCPDYVSNYFNCNATGQYMNITGKYCYGNLVCENKWRLK